MTMNILKNILMMIYQYHICINKLLTMKTFNLMLIYIFLGWRPKELVRIDKIQDDLRLFLAVEYQEAFSLYTRSRRSRN